MGIWIYLFHGDMFSYQSNLPSNLNHSIQMSDVRVKAKTLSWGRREKRNNTSLEHTHMPLDIN